MLNNVLIQDAQLAQNRLPMYLSDMKRHSTSGRIVIDVDPKIKRQLYSALQVSGDTLKDWFIKEASNYSYQVKDAKPAVAEKEMKYGAAADKSKEPRGRKTKFKVVSMFSGCGGLDLGFQGGFEIFGQSYEKNPFEIIWANDLNKAACDTYKKNVGNEVHCGDIWEVMDSLPKKADVVIGGFPCQDISVNGKRAGANGARSGLYRAMVEVVRRVRPKVFVAENVKGLLMKYNEDSLNQVLSDFRSLGYEVSYQLYNAADYGVPQTRDRVFIVGTKKGIKRFSPPAAVRTVSQWMSAKEAIGDLEDAPKNLELNHIWSQAAPSSEQGNRKLKADRPGYTIRAECHGNIQFHYSKHRRISMREAARFQTFPDKFLFQGGLRETERQIGNAVPPVMAWHISKAVLQLLSKNY